MPEINSEKYEEKSLTNVSFSLNHSLNKSLKMYIYNVTINIENSLHDEWLVWIETHISDVLNTGKFTSAKLTEVLAENESGRTYSVQYSANSRKDLDDYYQFDADKLRSDAIQKFGSKMLAFRTELKLVKEFYPINTSN